MARPHIVLGAAGLPADNPKNIVNSVFKAFKVLQAFSPTQQTLTVSEVAVATEMDRGTAFRLLHTLVSLEYVRQVPVRRFRLTLKCLELGFIALSAHDLRTHAKPMLQDCVPSLADAASLGTLDNADVVYLERIDAGLSRHNLDRRAGRRVRAYGAALGHCMLGYLSEVEQVRILESAERVKLAERTLVDLDQLMARLRGVRSQGYAISDGENAFGLRTVAAPVLDNANFPVAGVSLTVDSERMPIKALIESALPRTLSIAAELARAIRLSADAINVDSSR